MTEVSGQEVGIVPHTHWGVPRTPCGLAALVVIRREPGRAADILYHYTDGEGLRGIIESRQWRASDCLFLNDAQEIRFAYELAMNDFKDLRAADPSADDARSIAEMQTSKKPCDCGRAGR